MTNVLKVQTFLLEEVSDVGSVVQARCIAALAMLKEFYPKMSTRGTYTTKIRNEVRKMAPSVHQALLLKYFNLSLEEWTSRNADNAVARAAKAPIKAPTNIVDGTSVAIRIMSEPLQWITGGATKSHAYQVLSAIAFLTGRRELEILKTGSFEQFENGLILFHGQVKTRGVVKEAYPIFLLGSVSLEKLNEMLTAARTRLAIPVDADHVFINSNYGKAFAKQSAAIFQMTPHQLRAAYADACFAQYGNGSALILGVFVEHLLGHSGTSASTYYQRVYTRAARGGTAKVIKNARICAGNRFGEYVRGTLRHAAERASDAAEVATLIVPEVDA